MRTLSAREQSFVNFYILACGNTAKAAREAGYSESDASRAGARLLKRPRVKEAIEVAQAKLREEANETRTKMFKKLQDVIEEARLGDYPNYAAILKAMEMQCKMLGYFEPEKEEPKSIDVSISVLNTTTAPPLGDSEGTLPPALAELADLGEGGDQ